MQGVSGALCKGHKAHQAPVRQGDVPHVLRADSDFADQDEQMEHVCVQAYPSSCPYDCSLTHPLLLSVYVCHGRGQFPSRMQPALLRQCICWNLKDKGPLNLLVFIYKGEKRRI